MEHVKHVLMDMPKQVEIVVFANWLTVINAILIMVVCVNNVQLVMFRVLLRMNASNVKLKTVLSA